MTYKKTYHSGIFLLILIFAWMLYPLYYSVSIGLEKYAQQSKLSINKQQECEQLELGVEVFARQYDEKEKELYLDGKMYDVLRYSVNKHSVNCIVVHDDHETNLVSSLLSLFKTKKDGKTAHVHNLILPVAFIEAIDSFVPMPLYAQPVIYPIAGNFWQGDDHAYKCKRPPRCT